MKKLSMKSYLCVCTGNVTVKQKLAPRPWSIAEPVVAQLGSGQTAAASLALLSSKRGGCTLNFSANIPTAQLPESFKKMFRWNFRQALLVTLKSLVFSLRWVPTSHILPPASFPFYSSSLSNTLGKKKESQVN